MKESPQAEVKWCCQAFKERWAEAGCRGFGIVIGLNPEGTPFFFLQFRITDIASAASVRFPESPVPISSVGEMGLRYCPWCGAVLAKQYAGAAGVLAKPELLLGSL